MVSFFSGGPATSPSTLSHPHSVVCDEQGNVYVADTFNQEVRLIIENFETTIALVNGTNQITLTWDSLPGRTYQLQTYTNNRWQNAPLEPTQATSTKTSLTFPLTGNKSAIHRILLLGF